MSLCCLPLTPSASWITQYHLYTFSLSLTKSFICLSFSQWLLHIMIFPLARHSLKSFRRMFTFWKLQYIILADQIIPLIWMGQTMLPHFAPINFFFNLGCKSCHSSLSGYQGCSKGSLQVQDASNFSCVWISMWILTNLMILEGSFHLTTTYSSTVCVF